MIVKKKVIKENKNFIFDRPKTVDCKSVARSAYYYLKASRYRALLMANSFVNRKYEAEKKYNVCICAIFKDEGEFLREWIEFHLIVGIDHFYLYNNNSSDNYKEVLEPYVKRGVVSLIDWPKQQAQIEAYNDAIKRYSKETKWLGFIDLDEFVVPVKYDNVYDYLKRYDNKAAAILIYWRVFGSSGIVKRDKTKLVTEQFRLAFPKWDDVGKCFYNTKYEFANEINGINHVMHHYFWCQFKGQVFPPINVQNKISFPGHNILNGNDLPIQINHYLTKSYEDYYNKAMNKTDVFFKENPRKMDYFFHIDSYCTKEDVTIAKYITRLKINMERKSEAKDS